VKLSKPMAQRLFEGELITYVAANSSALQEIVASTLSRETGLAAPRASAPVVRAPAPPATRCLPGDIAFSRPRGLPVTVSAPVPESSGRLPDSWLIGLSKRFKESVAKTDRKRQGRILEAVVSLTEDPMKVVGDTVKPLSEDKKGYWRRRVGDYRLTYYPDPDSGLVTLVDFEARGSAYA
jgi:mRNA-degrading endonuclease RelE of RelBE toxin-antitoxin system